MLAPLALRVVTEEFRMLISQQGVLRLVLPTIITVLEHAAADTSDTGTALQFQQVDTYRKKSTPRKLSPLFCAALPTVAGRALSALLT